MAGWLHAIASSAHPRSLEMMEKIINENKQANKQTNDKHTGKQESKSTMDQKPWGIPKKQIWREICWKKKQKPNQSTRESGTPPRVLCTQKTENAGDRKGLWGSTWRGRSSIDMARNQGSNDWALGWAKWSRTPGAAMPRRQGLSWGRLAIKALPLSAQPLLHSTELCLPQSWLHKQKRQTV